VILSNHVPELAEIVKHHDIERYFDAVLTSATLGFEKPHPMAFKSALGSVDPAKACMIGDNPIADTQGAHSVGMTGILVRHSDADFETVLQAVEVILVGT
jgi:putative hydrolase of the HAD superfamily